MDLLAAGAAVIIGALVTVLASRYYFRRSISKKLGVYRLLNLFVFEGIAPDVRDELQFRFQNREVNELQQVLFLVANDGERAIRDVIERLTLSIPSEVEILNASIVYRQPEGLKADIVPEVHPGGGTDLKLDFPLLNKREFFVVKLLLSGRFRLSSLNILCDDLPRTVKVEPLPPGAVQDAEYKFEWIPAAIGLACLLLAAWACYSAYLLHGFRPALFHPVTLRQGGLGVGLEPLLFVILGAAQILIFLLFGIGLIGVAIFGGEFPPARGPRFKLSKELQRMIFPYPMLHFRSTPGEHDENKKT